MEVGLDDQLDGEAELLGVGEVFGHVALRVDDDRPSRRLVADEIRRVRQTVQVVLDELHGSHPSANTHTLWGIVPPRSCNTTGGISVKGSPGHTERDVMTTSAAATVDSTTLRDL